MTRSWYAVSGMIPGTSAATEMPVGAPEARSSRPVAAIASMPMRVGHLVKIGVAGLLQRAARVHRPCRASLWQRHTRAPSR